MPEWKRMRQLIAGNWKMNGTSASLAEIRAIADGIRGAAADVLICPPTTLIGRAGEAAKGLLPIGGQDCDAEASGAFTGDVSAEMLKDAGASAVIVGHSERRQYHGETSVRVAAKARAAWRAGLYAIICVGETERERDAGRALHVCADQLSASVPDGANSATTAVAYEPVWAIGTGRTPTTAQIAEVHAHIKTCMVARLGPAAREIRVLYGGSVRAANAREILGVANVDGALVGGASLDAQEFLGIVAASAANR
jgi:triosephosphate isomerase